MHLRRNWRVWIFRQRRLRPFLFIPQQHMSESIFYLFSFKIQLCRSNPTRNNLFLPFQWRDTWIGVESTPNNNNNIKRTTFCACLQTWIIGKTINTRHEWTYIMVTDSDWGDVARRLHSLWVCTIVTSPKISPKSWNNRKMLMAHIQHTFIFCSAACKNFNKRQNICLSIRPRKYGAITSMDHVKLITSKQ